MSDNSDLIYVKGIGHYFWCPGCKCPHHYTVPVSTDHKGAKWSVKWTNGLPTFTPSLLVFRPKNKHHERKTLCHLFVTAGKIIYCADSPHELAGKTIDMTPYPENWKG